LERREFLKRALDAAREARNRTGARFSPVIAAAQAALESNWGRSQLAIEANNLKGIKAGSSWHGEVLELPTREWRESDNTWYTTMARWRVYRDWEHAFSDYGALIERVYPHAAAVADDPRAFLEALVAGPLKYATDPGYIEKVWTIVQQYRELLLEPEPKWLLIMYDHDGEIAYRLPLPHDALIRIDTERKRIHVRPDPIAKMEGKNV
jgi:flagellum-specific peptidoglycan hydrolase FlgJ